MFKKPSQHNAALRTVTLDNLGNAEKTKKGKVTFVPMFRVTEDGPGLSLSDIQDGIYGWFVYQFRTKGDEPGKPKTHKIVWMDSLLRAGEDDATINDPGVTLGLNLNQDARKSILGFGVTGLNFPDPNAYRKTVRVPVLWNVEPNDDGEGNISAKSGELVLLELKVNQLNQIVAEMKKVSKPKVTYEYVVGGESKNEPYKYQGYGYAYLLDKDTSRKMKTYEFSKLDMTVQESHWRNNIDAAVKAFTDYKTNAYKVGRFYGDVVERCMNGEIPFDIAEREVVAMIAQRLLDAWGISYGDTVEDIIATFNSVLHIYSYQQGAGITDAAKNPVRVSADGDDENDEDAPF